MTTQDPIERFRGLDPAENLPYTEPSDGVLEGILALPRDHLAPSERRRTWRPSAFTAITARSTGAADPRPSHRRLRRGLLAGLPLGVGAAATAVVLLVGSSGPGLNVAAAAYAATAPKQGLVEYLSLVRIYRGPNAGSTLRQQEWIEASTARRRELDTITEPRGRSQSTRVRDWSFAPRASESWESGRGSNVVLRVSRPPTSYYPDHPGFDIGGITLDGVEGIKFFRLLYRDGQVRVVGRERRDGQLLWKLESHPEQHGIDDHTRLIVLVDPHTFLPVFERQIDIALPGHPVIVESQLLSYRTVLATAASASVFDLAAQHPGTQVLSTVPPPPPALSTRRSHPVKRR
jgi:hypothetical protein